ncbi:MAG: hypothetical protein KF838_00915 [Phycisphaeraceae bacterium]|nr:MAG: hypothetical protein KF838_00915 [Phycisphaeraceae bacterium]
MKSTLAILALAVSPAAVHAAGNLVVTGIPQAPSIGSGGSVGVDLWVNFGGVTGGLAFAGFKFDVLGHANGTLIGNVNNTVLNQGVNNGIPSGSNLLDMGAGQLPPSFPGCYLNNPVFLGTVTFTDSGTAAANYTVSLSIVDYISPLGVLNVYIGASGTQSRSGLTSTASTHTVQFAIGSFDVIIPTPASMALLGLGGLVAGRRRR